MSNKVEDFLSGLRLGEIVHSKKEEERKANKWLIIGILVGFVLIVAVVAYIVYKALTPEDVEDFEDEFDDGFNDFDDDEDDLLIQSVPTSLKDEDYDLDEED